MRSTVKAPYQSEREALGKRVNQFFPCDSSAKSTPGKLLCLDLFAGGGGFAQAVSRSARAHGYEVDHRLVNHWSVALDTARANLGNVSVFNSAVQDLDPHEVVPEGYVDIMTASPECIFFSSARGAKPINDQRRSTAAEVLRFMEELHVETLVLENVSELESWGPLNAEGRPIKEQKGKFFKAFIRAIKRLGYNVDYRHVVAANYGDPTTRKRLFLIAQKRRPVSFPAQTHSKDGKIPGTAKWVPARAIIDFSVKGLSIFDRPTPHVPKTLRRIEIGFADQVARTPLAAAYVEAVKRFKGVTELYYAQIENLPSRKQLGRQLTKEERAEVKAVKAAAQQQHRLLVEEAFADPVAVLSWEDILLHQNVEPTLEGDKHLALGTLNVVNPIVTKLYGTGTTSDVNDPLDTVTAGGINFGVARPVPDTFLVTVNHGDTNSESGRHASIDAPLGTITTKGSQGVVSAFCLRANASDTSAWDDAVTELDDPLRTITTKNNLSLVLPDATILPHHTDTSSSPQPAITISRDGLVQPIAADPQPFIASYYGPKGERDRRPRSVDEPLATQPTANRFSLVQAETTIPSVDPVLVSQHYGFDNTNPSLDEPVVTASTRGAGYIASPEAVIISRNNARRGERRPHSLGDPMPTATGSGAGYLAEPVIDGVGALNEMVEPAIVNMKGQSTATSSGEPLPTQTAHAPHLYLAEGSITPVDAVIIPQQRGEGVDADSIDRPLRSLTTKNGTGVAMPTNDIALDQLSSAMPSYDLDISNVERGKPYIIVSGAVMQLDCLYRMLTPDELAKAMSFSDETHQYKFKTRSTSQRVKMIGNAVAIKTASALITHALAHRFSEAREALAA